MQIRDDAVPSMIFVVVCEAAEWVIADRLSVGFPSRSPKFARVSELQKDRMPRLGAVRMVAAVSD